MQRILGGEQYMTVYQAIKPEAGDAAEQPTSNGQQTVPSIILTPVAVTRARPTVGQMITDGFLKATDICSGPAATACHQLGLSQ